MAESTGVAETLSRLAAARDRFLLFGHGLAASWEGTDPASPASRDELVNSFAALSDVLAPMTEMVVWMVRTLHDATNEDGLDDD